MYGINELIWHSISEPQPNMLQTMEQNNQSTMLDLGFFIDSEKIKFTNVHIFL